MKSRYDFELDMKNDNSLSIMIKMMEARTKVLEIGCANGRMTQYLKENLKCTVDIIEIDEIAGKEAKKYSRKYCIGTIEGDIEKDVWENRLKGETYDYIIFADVLEHLHNPQEVLIRVKSYLKDTGSIILSTPNLAHNAIILKLFNHQFEYQEIGLLDKTHIHFFTYHSLKNMIRNSGYICEQEKATYCDTEHTELGASFEEIPMDMRKFIRNRKYGNVYQFVFRVRKKQETEENEVSITQGYERDLEYRFKCYYKLEGMETYSEEYCKTTYFVPGRNCFCVEIEDKGKITGLRIDPMECNCILTNFHVYDLLNAKKEISIKYTNGVESGVSFVFDTNDPMIEVNLPENLGKIIVEVCFDVEKYESEDILYFFNMIINGRQLVCNVEKEKEAIKEESNLIKEQQKRIEEAYETDIFNLKQLCVELEKEKQQIELQMKQQQLEREKEMAELTEELSQKLDNYNEEYKKIKEIYEDSIQKLISKCEILEKEKKEALLEQIGYFKEKEVLGAKLEYITEQKNELEKKFEKEQNRYCEERENLQTKLEEIKEKIAENVVEFQSEKMQLYKENETLKLNQEMLLKQKEDLEKNFQIQQQEYTKENQKLKQELEKTIEQVKEKQELEKKSQVQQQKYAKENQELKQKLEKTIEQIKEKERLQKRLQEEQYKYEEEKEKLEQKIKESAKQIKEKEEEFAQKQFGIQEEKEELKKKLEESCKEKQEKEQQLNKEIAKKELDLESINIQYLESLNQRKELQIQLNRQREELQVKNIEQDNYKKENEQLKMELEKIVAEKRDCELRVSDYMAKSNYYEQSMNMIINSNSWKLTKGYRLVGDILRGRKKKSNISNSINNTQEILNIPVTNSNSDRIIYFGNSEELAELNQSIAVHLHLYYIDLLEEFFNYLNHIPYKFDLYVSCKEDGYVKKITKKMKRLKCVQNVTVRRTINRGRDIAPFYVQFGKELCNYDYLLHIHSKKSLFTGSEQKEWRQYCLECLLGSEEQVRRIFALMTGEKNVGLFFPETIKEMHLIAHDWLANQHWGRTLLGRMGIEFDNGLFNYPVGSFFWVKRDAIHQIFDMQLAYEDFEEEGGQTDGTIAHALERVLPFVAKNNGYRLGIFDLESKQTELDYSYKLYQSYFSLTSDAVQYHLSQYELVTFDIFDTLITRCVLCPDDVFEIVRRKIKRCFGLDINFLEVRKKAEALANETKFDKTSIHDIYREMPRVSKKINSKLAKKIMAIEIETELEVCIPRRDMLKVFNHVKQNGRKIILISDMYLTSDIIGKMLKKCGYEGYESIIVSCEVGLRKDRNTIWDDFYGKYGDLKSVHVGDNPRSDIQLVGDRLKHTFYVMNPFTAFKLSKAYSVLKKYVNTTLENAIMLGLLVNGELYNSPFSMNAEGEPEINNPNVDGYVGLGPVFTVFSEWLSQNQTSNTEYWFLAREGFVFNEMYRRYLENANKTASHTYFLTSRRSASVAAIKTTEDIKEILQQFYRGGLHNLLITRLGFMEHSLEEIELEMPRDIDVVMEMIKPYEVNILSAAEKERNAYLQYIECVRKKGKRIEVVDVGYSGTIQYFLMKLMEQRINGKYLSTQTERKPEKLGGIVESVYFNHTLEEQDNSIIFKNQLLLEAILQAPHGQVVKFDIVDDKVVSILKENKGVPENITAFQNGAIEYVAECTKLAYFSEIRPEYDKNLAEDILNQYLLSGWMSDGVSAELSVEDDYCTGGTFKYNKGQWKERG